MTSHGKTRPLLTLAMIAALAAGVSACNSGATSAQYGTGSSNSSYNGGTNSNESGSLYWQNQAQQNVNSATSDMGPGGVADPADESNSVSYSGDGSDD